VLPFRELNVYSDGKAVLCCDDWNEEYVVGDLNTQSLGEIWRGEALTRARKAHLESRGADLSVCAKCNLWRDPGPAKLWA
jgi:radical SAM protein with 4Fe4S-binding SPASM domain